MKTLMKLALVLLVASLLPPSSFAAGRFELVPAGKDGQSSLMVDTQTGHIWRRACDRVCMWFRESVVGIDTSIAEAGKIAKKLKEDSEVPSAQE